MSIADGHTCMLIEMLTTMAHNMKDYAYHDEDCHHDAFTNTGSGQGDG